MNAACDHGASEGGGRVKFVTYRSTAEIFFWRDAYVLEMIRPAEGLAHYARAALSDGGRVRQGFAVVLLACAVASVVPTTSRAQEDEDGAVVGVPNGSNFACSVGALRLEEIVRRANSGEEFVQQWSGLLKRVASCMKQRHMRNTCLSVQGRYAPLHFEWGDQAPDAAIGSQKLGADARAVAVRSHLQSEGVEGRRIVVLPPPDHGTYEGVRLRIAHDCTDGSAEGGVAYGERRGLSAEVGIYGSGSFLGPARSGAGVLRVGVGYQAHSLYGRLDAGLLTSSSETQRGGWELGAALGLDLTDWVQLGVVFSYRQGADKLFAEWLERMWTLGVESRQCTVIGRTLWSVCLREALMPVGQQSLRGQIVQGRVFRVPASESAVLRADVGLSLTRGF